jgi:peptidyl-prolyl cis-trans isomerase SurA
MLNRIFLLTSILFISILNLTAQDEVVMEINGQKVTKSEFLQIYLKNNDNPKYDKASLDEYMDLFTKFKLKVAEAEALGYDEIEKRIRRL